jgi:hypothetical protein
VNALPLVSARRSFAFAFAVVTALLLALGTDARAETFTVTNLENSGTGSLREAVKEANSVAGADVIVFAPGLAGKIALSGTGLTITDPVEIDGPGAASLTVEQTSAEHRVFKIDELTQPGAVALSGLHITGGRIKDYGADIYNQDSNASLTISGCVVSGADTEDAGYGGAVDSFGAPLFIRDSTFVGNEGETGGAIWAGGDEMPLVIEASTFAENVANGDGGAVAVEVEHGSEHRIVDSTFVSNRATEGGGAVEVSAGNEAAVLIANSTFTGNQAVDAGGALGVGADSLEVTIEDSTVAGNSVTKSTGEGGGIDDFDVQRLTDTIVADNTSAGTAPDLSGKALASFDLVQNSAGAELVELTPGSNLVGVDPQLGPLAANGGPTETMALAPTSPAVNKGGGALTTDQRGDPRPVIYPGVPLSGAAGANGDDIGAYELAPPPASPTPPVPPGNPPPPAKKKKLRPPRVRLSCPKSAMPTGCHFALQVFSAKPHRGKGKGARPVKPVAESLVTVANLRPGRTVEPTLTPKPKFAARLDAAKSLLVREAATIGGKRTVSYRRIKVVG